MIPQQHGIGRIIPVALILIFGAFPARSLICYSCIGCYGAPTNTTSSGSICMTYNETCVAGSIYSTSLGLITTSSNLLCGTISTPYTSTINGIIVTCTGAWSCCYTNFCNNCPSVGCAYTSASTGAGTGGSNNNGNVLRMSIFGSSMLATILILIITCGYTLNMH